MYFFMRALVALSVCCFVGCSSWQADSGREQKRAKADATEAHHSEISTSSNKATTPSVAQASRELQPKPSVPRKKIKQRKQQPRFDVVASDAPAKEFFMSLVEGSDMNMIVHPDVSGNITIKLKRVTLDEALKAIRDSYGYDFLRKVYGYQIVPRELQSKIFRINYLNINRIGRSATAVSSGQITSSESSSSGSSGSGSSSNSGTTATVQSTQIETQSESHFWAKLENLLSMIVGAGDGRQVVVDADSGIAVVKAYPSELRYVEDFLEKAQLSLQRQVVIEAKILEVNLGDGYQAGIQ